MDKCDKGCPMRSFLCENNVTKVCVICCDNLNQIGIFGSLELKKVCSEHLFLVEFSVVDISQYVRTIGIFKNFEF